MQTDSKKHETPTDANNVLVAGVPLAIWVKGWSERFVLLQDGDKIGYANDSGWFFCSESKDELSQEYLELYNGGVINPCH